LRAFSGVRLTEHEPSQPVAQRGCAEATSEEVKAMSKEAISHFQASTAASVLRKLFGTHRTVALLVLAVVITLNWFASGCRRLWDEWPEVHWYLILLETLPAVLLIGWLFWQARRAPHVQRPSIDEKYHPPQVRALVIFLSSPWDPPIDEKLLSQTDGSPRRLNRGFLDALGRNPWRMPLEAIAYHARHREESDMAPLERVVVIPSHDRPFDTTDSSKSKGTYHHFETFKTLVEKLVSGDRQLSNFRVENLHSLVASATEKRQIWKDYAKGVDFESPKELEEAVFDAYDALHLHGLENDEILVDVTSGQKPASIAGAVVALGKDRRIQYVSTHDYQVRAYDVTFDE
jgi:hypothetical protein